MFTVALLLLDCDCASVEDTVVLETCREPDDLRPFDEPELGEFWLPRDDVRGGCGPVGGLPPFRGLPGGRVSRETAGRAMVAG